MQWPESRKERGTTSDSCSQVITSSPSRGLQAWHSETAGESVCTGLGADVLSRVLGARNPAFPELLWDPASFPALRHGKGFHPCTLSLVGDSKPRQAELGSAFIRLVLL